MGARRRTLLLGFVVALFLGVAIYFRLWAIDNESFSADDREVLRRSGGDLGWAKMTVPSAIHFLRSGSTRCSSACDSKDLDAEITGKESPSSLAKSLTI